MSRLTKEQVEARMEMYDEAVTHLEMDVADTEVEKEQAVVVVKQIRAMAGRFYRKSTA